MRRWWRIEIYMYVQWSSLNAERQVCEYWYRGISAIEFALSVTIGKGLESLAYDDHKHLRMTTPLPSLALSWSHEKRIHHQVQQEDVSDCVVDGRKECRLLCRWYALYKNRRNVNSAKYHKPCMQRREWVAIVPPLLIFFVRQLRQQNYNNKALLRAGGHVGRGPHVQSQGQQTYNNVCLLIIITSSVGSFIIG